MFLEVEHVSLFILRKFLRHLKSLRFLMIDCAGLNIGNALESFAYLSVIGRGKLHFFQSLFLFTTIHRCLSLVDIGIVWIVSKVFSPLIHMRFWSFSHINAWFNTMQSLIVILKVLINDFATTQVSFIVLKCHRLLLNY